MQLDRTLEEVFGRDRKELRLVLGGVGVEERELTAIDGVEKLFELASEVVRPGRNRTLSCGEAETLRVEVVRELVQRDVVAFAGKRTPRARRPTTG